MNLGAQALWTKKLGLKMIEKGLRSAILPLVMGHFNTSSNKISKKEKKKRFSRMMGLNYKWGIDLCV